MSDRKIKEYIRVPHPGKMLIKTGQVQSASGYMPSIFCPKVSRNHGRLKANKDVLRSGFCRGHWMCLQERQKEGDRREHSRCPRGRLKAKVSSRSVIPGRKQGDASLWGTFVGPVRKCWRVRARSGVGRISAPGS